MQASLNYLLFAQNLQSDVIEPYEEKLDQQRHEFNSLRDQHNNLLEEIKEKNRKLNEIQFETEQVCKNSYLSDT